MVYPRADSYLRLKQAVRRHRALSREGLLERVFERLFRGLVYTQIWEDPEVDLEALALQPDSHVVAIASGGCNVLSYLIDDPARITAVDLSRAHVALNRLKLVAASRLPSWEVFYRFFGAADDEANVAAYERLIAPHLDSQSRLYGRDGACSSSAAGESRSSPATPIATAYSAPSSGSPTRSRAPTASTSRSC